MKLKRFISLILAVIVIVPTVTVGFCVDYSNVHNINSVSKHMDSGKVYPYEVPTAAQVWEELFYVVLAALGGNLGDSQNETWMTFMKDILIRMSSSDEYNLNFDYDMDKDLIFDDDTQGLGKIGFDYDAGQGIFYSAHNPWMRKFGYCLAYDLIAPLIGTRLITKRIDFNYDGYEYRLQLWKGVYGWISYGAEIGLYYREPGSTVFKSFYNCVPDDRMIGMQMDLYLNGEKKFSREMQTTWWRTGFVVNDKVDENDVSFDAKIVFPNEEMTEAFLNSFEKNGYVKDETYFVDLTTVSFAY